jgi:hypothetical protein
VSEVSERPDTSQVLSEFWMELLDLDSVGPDDHLLELGGNSLVATMVANRIELAWGFRPTIAVLMTASLHEIAQLCEQNRAG